MTIFLVKHPRARVHATVNGRPLCGGGNGARAAQWQRDIGPETCRKCKQIAHAKITKLSTPPPFKNRQTTRFSCR